MALGTITDQRWQPSVGMTAAWSVLALLNVIAQIWGIRQQGTLIPLQTSMSLEASWQPNAAQVLDLAQGRFLLRPEKPSVPASWAASIWGMVIVALYFWGSWWRGHGALPEHAGGLLGILFAITAIVYGALLNAHRLRNWHQSK